MRIKIIMFIIMVLTPFVIANSLEIVGDSNDNLINLVSVKASSSSSSNNSFSYFLFDSAESGATADNQFFGASILSTTIEDAFITSPIGFDVTSMVCNYPDGIFNGVAGFTFNVNTVGTALSCNTTAGGMFCSSTADVSVKAFDNMTIDFEEVVTATDGHVSCQVTYSLSGGSGGGSGADLTNVAFLNNSQTFTEENTFEKNISFTNSPLSFINNLRGITTLSSSSFFFDAIGNARWFFRNATDSNILEIGETNGIISSRRINVTSGNDVCITGGNCLSSVFNGDLTNVAFLNNSQTFTLENIFTGGLKSDDWSNASVRLMADVDGSSFFVGSNATLKWNNDTRQIFVDNSAQVAPVDSTLRRADFNNTKVSFSSTKDGIYNMTTSRGGAELKLDACFFIQDALGFGGANAIWTVTAHNISGATLAKQVVSVGSTSGGFDPWGNGACIKAIQKGAVAGDRIWLKATENTGAMSIFFENAELTRIGGSP